MAFRGYRLVARGSVEAIVARLHPLSSAAQADLRLLDETTGRTVDFDWRGDADAVVERARAQLADKGKGRPRLGVESREITLLPRHWKWLEAQGGSASAALRTLVDREMKQVGQSRADIDALYWQMSALAGDLPGFEEATRCLYSADRDEVERIFRGWPEDLGGYFIERLGGGTADEGGRQSGLPAED
ncbi:MAG TPA: DUF2239 family protein [Acidiphilium sp.]